MLIATANWRITDGTLAAGPSAHVVHRWRTGVQRSVLRAGFRRDGRYRPVEAVDLVLAGDTFDWLVSNAWLGETRPWHGGSRAAAAVERVAGSAFHRGRRLLATLASWARRGIAVPEADRHGRPSASVERRLPVRVAVLSGDRDAALEHVAGRRAMAWGLAVGHVWSTKDVAIRHGHECDPLCDAALGRPTLAESVAVDLIVPFGADIMEATDLASRASRLVRCLGAGAPGGVANRLADWLLARDIADAPGAAWFRTLIDTWNRRVAMWHRVARRLPPRSDAGVDLVDCLAESLELRPPFPRRPDSIPRRPGAACPKNRGPRVIVGHASCEVGIFAPALHPGPSALETLAGPPGPEEDREPSAGVVRIDHGGCTVDEMPLGPRGWEATGAAGNGVWVSGAPGRARARVDAA